MKCIFEGIKTLPITSILHNLLCVLLRFMKIIYIHISTSSKALQIFGMATFWIDGNGVIIVPSIESYLTKKIQLDGTNPSSWICNYERCPVLRIVITTYLGASHPPTALFALFFLTRRKTTTTIKTSIRMQRHNNPSPIRMVVLEMEGNTLFLLSA